MQIANVYKSLEEGLNVVYPFSENATYISPLNYSNEKKTSRQRWYRYKEGFSIEMVKDLINEYSSKEEGIILDPFLGSGSTLLGANQLNFHGIGYEVNPFSNFLAKCKLTNYNENERDLFSKLYPQVLKQAEQLANEEEQPLPKLSISDKVFHSNIQNYFLSIKRIILELTVSENVKNLLFIGWLSSIEPVSQYRKAGNGLKRKVASKNNVNSIESVNHIIKGFYEAISEDLNDDLFNYDSNIYNKSSLTLHEEIEDESITGVIFSPPYANSFDYTEIYKLELWFGDFVKEYSDLKKLRTRSLRSHLNGLTLKSIEDDIQEHRTLKELEILLEQLETKELWNNKIPYMLKKYFSEMFYLLEELYEVLENDGFCSIVVGNSAYGGVIFPTDILLAKYAKKIGFEVDGVFVDRFIITSSQQYEITLEEKDFLRESIVCLKKKKK